MNINETVKHGNDALSILNGAGIKIIAGTIHVPKEQQSQCIIDAVNELIRNLSFKCIRI